MKLSVDQEKCIGCGACVAISPDNFDFNEEGLSYVKNDEITEKTISAKEACPVYAIVTEDVQSEEKDNVVSFEEHKCADCNGECECEEKDNEHKCTNCNGECECEKEAA